MLNPENLYFVLISSFIYSLIEIELEGKNGWMTRIPTANVVYFGGKYLTLYHIYMILIIITGVCFQNRMEFTFKSFLHSASYVFLFLLLEDVLWFIFNPYFTIKKYKKDIVWWHSKQPWIYGIPFHNYLTITLNCIISYITGISDIIYSIIYSIIFLGFSVLLSPLYHEFYRYVHNTRSKKSGMVI